jgi:uncharacterized protein (TIGR02117 family)
MNKTQFWKIFKKVAKYIAISLASFIAFVLLYMLSAYSFSRIAVNKEIVNPQEIEIFIKSNGVHTDIVCPVKNEIIDWTKDFKFENTKSKDTNAKYLAFGWGDKGFDLETPTWAELKFSVAFKAVFALSTSAIHSTFYKELKEDSNCVSIKISKNEYKSLVNYIRESLILDNNGRAINIKTNALYGTDDSFYEAKGSYSLLHTCNTWANNALKSCNQKAAFWTPFDTGIFYHYQKH